MTALALPRPVCPRPHKLGFPGSYGELVDEKVPFEYPVFPIPLHFIEIPGGVDISDERVSADDTPARREAYRPFSQSTFPEVRYKSTAAGNSGGSSAGAPSSSSFEALNSSVLTLPGWNEMERMVGCSVNNVSSVDPDMTIYIPWTMYSTSLFKVCFDICAWSAMWFRVTTL